ncbi:KAP family P-loop NTPase fold protein [Pseudomonas sp. HLG18]|uniref:KAP family P-loop NTPase fold protein n=1 Tax=Pseudomonas sp. HLG18 TaxID=3449277 RepID=UPI003F749DC4
MSKIKDVWADDFMGRKPSSEFLTTYILANPHVKVLNVNSPWGSGKSFFLERWKADLGKEHVCVLFNAWETDYAADPLVALITCIEQQIKDNLDVTATEAGRRAVDVGSDVLRKAVPLIAKGLIKKFVGVDFDDLLGEEGGENAADSVKDLVASLINDQSKTSRHVEEFKAAVIKRLEQAAENNNLSKPAFIFIDELDRCRPTYAIELLERIKHFFELEDCRFVIASDSKQLAHSIRAVYGQGFSSERYLNRFFDAEFNLDNSNIFNFVYGYLPEIKSVTLGVNVTGQVHGMYFSEVPVHPQRNTVVTELEGFTENGLILVGLVKYFGVELRELTNYLKQIKSAADTIGGEIHFFWLAYLIFFKSSKAAEYADLWSADKGHVAIQRLNEKAVGVTFSFTSELSNIKDMADFYLTILNANSQDLQQMRNLTSWRNTVYYKGINAPERERLKIYKDVVELAHRLN